VTVPLLHARLGTSPSQVQGVEYGEVVTIRGVRFSLYPAGHIPGSAQILVEHGGERWVFSGDYKTEFDGLSAAFEPVPCSTFISECTFGLPVFRFQPQEAVFQELNQWTQRNCSEGYSSIVCAYALGKAQRVLHNLQSNAPILLHGAVWNMCQALSMAMDSFQRVEGNERHSGALVVVPPSAVGASSWLKKFEPYRIATLSGWMAINGIRRRRATDAGFVLSDHADFAGLTKAVKDTGAERVLLTHGYTKVFARWLNEQGIHAEELRTSFGEDEAQTELHEESQ
jgi:putative mRNA 3-end processing factor